MMSTSSSDARTVNTNEVTPVQATRETEFKGEDGNFYNQ